MLKNLIIDWQKDMKIKSPCIIRAMPSEVYHSIEGLSTSGLKILLDCPAKYYYKYLSGEYEPKEKPAFKIGKACHKYILEGSDAFQKEYWHNPYSDCNKTEILDILRDKCRLLFSPDLKYMPLKGRSKIFNYPKLMRLIKALQAKYGNKSLKDYIISDLYKILFILDDINSAGIELNKNELNQVIGTARAIKSNQYALKAFSQTGESELSIFWIDEESGLLLKCRPDFLPYDCKLVPDYKTASSVNPQSFFSDFIKFGYHIQAAMYKEGIKAATGIEVEEFFFIAQEKEPPFITQVYLPPNPLIEYGYKGMRKAINTYLECKDKGFWDTYSDHIIQMSLDPKPDDLAGNFDKENSICYAPYFIDSILAQY